MVARVHDVGALNRAECRASATSRFSTARMAREHLELYHDVLADRLAQADRETMDDTRPLTAFSGRQRSATSTSLAS
jgi:hypothetical protein